MIDAGNARIKDAQIRQTNGGSVVPFLTLGFNTSYEASVNMTGSQALWAQQNLSTNSWFAFALIANDLWASYPTTAMDSDFDLYFGSTWFNAGIFPQTVWDLYSGSNYTFEGQDIIEQSMQEYTGDSTATNPATSPQRWGDYNTMVYDPNAIGPSGEPSFWSVEEATCPNGVQNCPNAGADESTTWVALEDPAPFFVGASEVETELLSNAACGIPYTLQTQIRPPSGAQNGDVLIAILEAGVPAAGATPTLPSGWTLLNIDNIGSTTMTSTGTCGFYMGSWIAVHTYSTSDTTSYTFSFSITIPTNTCCPYYCWLGESGAYLNSYRFAGTDFTKYLAYGFPNNDSGSNNTSTTQAITSTRPAERKVLTVFSGVGDIASGDEISSGTCASFSQPSGSPSLTVETSLTPDCTLPAFLSADLWNALGTATIGGYTESPGSLAKGGDQPLPAWQVFIPEPND